MKRTVAILLAIVVLLTGLPARAEDHLVSPSAVQVRLSQAAAQRQADLTALRSVLDSPAAVSASTGLGSDAHALSERVAVLSDVELRELARRAALLETDPVAGGIGKTLLIVAIVIALFFAVFAIACSGDRAAGCIGF
jgi:hypothetical protein